MKHDFQLVRATAETRDAKAFHVRPGCVNGVECDGTTTDPSPLLVEITEGQTLAVWAKVIYKAGGWQLFDENVRLSGPPVAEFSPNDFTVEVLDVELEADSEGWPDFPAQPDFEEEEAGDQEAFLLIAILDWPLGETLRRWQVATDSVSLVLHHHWQLFGPHPAEGDPLWWERPPPHNVLQSIAIHQNRAVSFTQPDNRAGAL